jgi:hypothetical protein
MGCGTSKLDPEACAESRSGAEKPTHAVRGSSGTGSVLQSKIRAETGAHAGVWGQDLSPPASSRLRQEKHLLVVERVIDGLNVDAGGRVFLRRFL